MIVVRWVAAAHFITDPPTSGSCTCPARRQRRDRIQLRDRSIIGRVTSYTPKAARHLIVLQIWHPCGHFCRGTKRASQHRRWHGVGGRVAPRCPNMPGKPSPSRAADFVPDTFYVPRRFVDIAHLVARSALSRRARTLRCRHRIYDDRGAGEHLERPLRLVVRVTFAVPASRGGPASEICVKSKNGRNDTIQPEVGLLKSAEQEESCLLAWRRILLRTDNRLGADPPLLAVKQHLSST